MYILYIWIYLCLFCCVAADVFFLLFLMIGDDRKLCALERRYRRVATGEFWKHTWHVCKELGMLVRIPKTFADRFYWWANQPWHFSASHCTLNIAHFTTTSVVVKCWFKMLIKNDGICVVSVFFFPSPFFQKCVAYTGNNMRKQTPAPDKKEKDVRTIHNRAFHKNKNEKINKIHFGLSMYVGRQKQALCVLDLAFCPCSLVCPASPSRWTCPMCTWPTQRRVCGSPLWN